MSFRAIALIVYNLKTNSVVAMVTYSNILMSHQGLYKPCRVGHRAFQ